MTRSVFALLGLFLAASVNAEEAKSPPTFNKDVAPILFSECSTCHRPGDTAPFSLLTYGDAKKRGKLIAQVTHSRQMPPWKADKGDVSFSHERRLKETQIALIESWVAADMPEGDAKDLPKAPVFNDGWPLGKPDLVVKMPKTFKVPAEGHDVYRNFALSTGLKEDKWVRAVDFRPSAPSVVHHTLFFLDLTGTAAKREADSGEVGSKGGMGSGRTTGKDRPAGGDLANQIGMFTGSGGLGGWTAGARPQELPHSLAYRLPKGADLILQTHFHPSGKAEEEASTVALYFTDKAPLQKFTGLQVPFGFGIVSGIDIPAGDKDYTIEDSFTVPVDVRAWGITAHAHYIAKEFTVTATPPDGKPKTLLKISDWDFAWQEQYQFQDFVDLPKGTKVNVKIRYDNSAENPRNPTSPPKRVRWGRESTDEMGSSTLLVVAKKEEELAKLQEGYATYVREAAIKGAMKRFMEKK
jgi:mono/diheme cytochrome c family protein